MAKNPEHFEQQLQRVSQNKPDLKKLNFAVSALNKDDITRLAHALAHNTHLTHLDLTNNAIGDEGVNVLADALANNTTITSLSLGINNIGPEGAKVLANNTTITTLDLSYNNIGDEGAIALANNTTITALELRDNNIGLEGAIALAHNNTITKLNLCNNHIGSSGAIALAHNATITSLFLNDNSIGPEGAIALAKNKMITILFLGGNNIGDDGAIALANNTTITTLICGDNIGNDGAIALVYNTMITTLVCGNNIGADGVTALVEALKKNTPLIWLYLFGNGLRDANRQAIEDELKTNQACPHIIKEQIQTLMNIRSTHPGSPLALIPNELMFRFFAELMPGFYPNTFMQQKFLPVDETTMTKARNKLKAIAAQQGLSIRLESPVEVNPPAIKVSRKRKKPAVTGRSPSLDQDPSTTLPAHYYAVTTQTIMTREGKTQFSTEELRQIFGSSTHCFLYTTAAQARQKRLECKKELMFWRTTTPLEFMITTAPIAEFTEGMQLERNRMTTVVYLHGRAPEQIELLQSCEHEQQLKRVVADAYDEYNRVSSSTTSTNSSDTGYSISSTSQLEPRHTTDGVTRALAFKESLEGLKYVELIEKMKDYAAGRFNGGFDPGKSFKAILYDKLIQHYGTQAQRDRLPTMVINREALLAAITEAEKQIKQTVFQDLPLQAHQGGSRQDLVQLTRPGSSPAK